MHVPHLACGEQAEHCGNWVSSSTMWVVSFMATLPTEPSISSPGVCLWRGGNPSTWELDSRADQITVRPCFKTIKRPIVKVGSRTMISAFPLREAFKRRKEKLSASGLYTSKPEPTEGLTSYDVEETVHYSLLDIILWSSIVKDRYNHKGSDVTGFLH